MPYIKIIKLKFLPTRSLHFSLLINAGVRSEFKKKKFCLLHPPSRQDKIRKAAPSLLWKQKMLPPYASPPPFLYPCLLIQNVLTWILLCSINQRAWTGCGSLDSIFCFDLKMGPESLLLICSLADISYWMCQASNAASTVSPFSHPGKNDCECLHKQSPPEEWVTVMSLSTVVHPSLSHPGQPQIGR